MVQVSLHQLLTKIILLKNTLSYTLLVSSSDYQQTYDLWHALPRTDSYDLHMGSLSEHSNFVKHDFRIDWLCITLQKPYLKCLQWHAT